MIKQKLIFLNYNKDVVCVIDKDDEPMCKMTPRVHRRESAVDPLPSYDPYIPRTNTLLYECSKSGCVPFKLNSITQLTSPFINIKSCYVLRRFDDYRCDTIKYHNFKNIDKLLFLKNNIPKKDIYIVDCLIYVDGGRVCHKKDSDVDSHTKLVDTGTITRPKETYVLALDEFICEEGPDKLINCDLNPYVAYEDGLRLKEGAKSNGEVLLKTGSFVVLLSRNCIGKWCGFSGQIKTIRRRYSYEPPGGKAYRCYYAQKQQICKEISSNQRNLFKDDNWLANAK